MLYATADFSQMKEIHKTCRTGIHRTATSKCTWPWWIPLSFVCCKICCMQIGNMWKASPCAQRGSCTEFCFYKKLVMKSWAYECHGLKQQVGMGKLMKEKVAMLSRDSKAFHCKKDRCSRFSPFSLSLHINSTLEKSIWINNFKGFPANIQKKGKQTKTCIEIFLIENLVECLKNFLHTGSIFLLTFQLKQKKRKKR